MNKFAFVGGAAFWMRTLFAGAFVVDAILVVHHVVLEEAVRGRCERFRQAATLVGSREDHTLVEPQA